MITLLDEDEFDFDAVSVVAPSKGDPIYDIPRMHRECAARGISSASLTDEEAKQYIIGYR